MRITKLAVVAAGLTLGLAACSSNGSSGSATSSASGSAGAPTAAPSSATLGANGGVANSCVVGTWKSTGANRAYDASGVHATATGGSGVLVTVARDGRTVIDFDSMQPMTFSAAAGGTNIKGSSVYGGRATGTVQVADGQATKGSWALVSPADWRDTTVTVDLQSPVQSRIFDHVKLGDFVGAGDGRTGGGVDPQPILRDATYACDGSTLTLGPPADSTVGGTWVLTRA